MSNITFLKKFLLNDQKIPELSQIYHHIYFRDMDALCIGGNDLMYRCVGLSENTSPNSIHYTEIIKDPATLTNVLNNDQVVLDNDEIVTFQENVNLQDQSNQNFFSIKAPLYSENELMGLCGISFVNNNYNLTEFMNIVSQISQLLQVDWCHDQKIDFFDQNHTQKPKLTPREIDCLSLCMRGNTTKIIANKLNLSNRTIEFYIENIKSKFGVNKRSELLSLAFNLYPELQQGLINQ